MSRKVFLSFLGTSPYVACNYDGIKNRKFIQDALIEKKCANWKDKDAIYIFLTKEAEEKNWNNNLEIILKNSKTKAQIIPVKNVPSGKSEEEIWEIFNMVYEKLEENDEIIYDITHSFRSLPMLGMTLLNYAKFLKNIKIKGIYYGAFEVLGRPNEVNEIPIEKRNAPVFDLTPFSTLQDWSVAADNFVNFGNTKKMTNLIYSDINPILKKTKGKDIASQVLKDFAKNLDIVSQMVSTCRGEEIVKGAEINNLKESLKNLKKESSFKALTPIIDKISEKIEPFSTDDIFNGFYAVKWCVDHNLIQQGITLMQETIITYLLKDIDVGNNRKSLRMTVSKAIEHILLEDKSNFIWNENEKRNLEILEPVLKENIEICNIYSSLRNHRNDINHGGYADNFKSGSFKTKLEQVFDKILKIVNK